MKKDSRQRCKRRLNTRMNESSEAVEDTNIKRILKDANVSFLLFFIPVIATICTYYFCRGYYNFFNIPPMFIEADFNFILEYVTLLTPLCVATILVCAIFVPTIGRKRKGLNHSEFVILNILELIVLGIFLFREINTSIVKNEIFFANSSFARVIILAGAIIGILLSMANLIIGGMLLYLQKCKRILDKPIDKYTEDEIKHIYKQYPKEGKFISNAHVLYTRRTKWIKPIVDLMLIVIIWVFASMFCGNTIAEMEISFPMIEVIDEKKQIVEIVLMEKDGYLITTTVNVETGEFYRVCEFVPFDNNLKMIPTKIGHIQIKNDTEKNRQ